MSRITHYIPIPLEPNTMATHTHTQFHGVLWLFVGYFGQILQQSQQLKEVGLFSLFLFASEKAEGCQLLSILHSQRFGPKI